MRTARTFCQMPSASAATRTKEATFVDIGDELVSKQRGIAASRSLYDSHASHVLPVLLLWYFLFFLSAFVVSLSPPSCAYFSVLGVLFASHTRALSPSLSPHIHTHLSLSHTHTLSCPHLVCCLSLFRPFAQSLICNRSTHLGNNCGWIGIGHMSAKV